MLQSHDALCPSTWVLYINLYLFLSLSLALLCCLLLRGTQHTAYAWSWAHQIPTATETTPNRSLVAMFSERSARAKREYNPHFPDTYYFARFALSKTKTVPRHRNRPVKWRQTRQQFSIILTRPARLSFSGENMMLTNRCALHTAATHSIMMALYLLCVHGRACDECASLPPLLVASISVLVSAIIQIRMRAFSVCVMHACVIPPRMYVLFAQNATDWTSFPFAHSRIRILQACARLFGSRNGLRAAADLVKHKPTCVCVNVVHNRTTTAMMMFIMLPVRLLLLWPRPHFAVPCGRDTAVPGRTASDYVDIHVHSCTLDLSKVHCFGVPGNPCESAVRIGLPYIFRGITWLSTWKDTFGNYNKLPNLC